MTSKIEELEEVLHQKLPAPECLTELELLKAETSTTGEP